MCYNWIMYTHTCEYCGKEFANPKRNRRFCSRRCKYAAARIPDDQPMSRRTRFRRRAAAGETQPVFRYPFNEHFFDNWDDHTAWLLGLIWSDGCLFRNTVEICTKDFQLAELVSAAIEQPDGLRSKNHGSAFRVVFTSKHLTERLRGLGLTERKSLTAIWPEIPREYSAHFVRGYLDGDGWVSMRHERPGQQAPDLAVGFCGAAPLVREGLENWFTSHDLSYYAGISAGRVWRITITNQDSLRKLYDLLYPYDDVLCLHRKNAPYAYWLSIPRARPGRPAR